MWTRFLIVLTLAAPVASPAVAGAAGPPVAIVGATIVHPERDGAAAVAPDSTVLIEGERIVAVGPRASVTVPRDAEIIAGAGKWLVPGLVDAHVHFFQSGNLYTRPDVADFNAVMPYAREVERNQARLPATFKVWLASGVTGVVDIGGPFWNFAVRDAAAASDSAPYVAVAGPLLSMVARPQLDLGDPPIIRVDSPRAGLELVARELERGPDYIKVWFIHRPGDDLAAQEAIVKAAGDAAHAAGIRLAVHATELVTAKAALRAGADYLVHSVADEPVDEEFIALARANAVLYCPTLFVTQGYRLALSNTWRPTPAEARAADPEVLAAMNDLDRIPAEQRPERVANAMREAAAVPAPLVAMQNLKRLHDAGITIVMGTDAGNIGTLHGPSVLREMRLMQEAGLSPLQVLRAATTHGAQALGRPDELGVIAPGQRADLVLLEADPLADSGNLARVHRVLRDGRVFEPEALLRALRRR